MVNRCVPLPKWTGMDLITGMDYRNGHLNDGKLYFVLVILMELTSQ